MQHTAGFDLSLVEICGVRTELARKGRGRPILFLHPGQGFTGLGPALGQLAQWGEVFAPSHPGFGRTERPAAITTVDDLAYFYLDFIEALRLEEILLIGASFGGWLAAEIVVRCAHAMAGLVLVDPLGIKVGDRTSRDIADMHSASDEQLAALLYADPARHRPDYASFSEDDLLTVARNSEATTLYGWRPYMYNPRLLGRLHRIRIPTLILWGEEDRVVTPEYGRAYAAAIPGARFEAIARAGHLAMVEQPERCAGLVGEFLGRLRA